MVEGDLLTNFVHPSNQRKAICIKCKLYNLLHSSFEIDHVSVIGGLSNSQELLLFFEAALNLTGADGSAVLEQGQRGDSVVIDNCGLHRGHQVC